jgi:hypothetical protein
VTFSKHCTFGYGTSYLATKDGYYAKFGHISPFAEIFNLSYPEYLHSKYLKQIKHFIQ